jgi:hypothetical protein
MKKATAMRFENMDSFIDGNLFTGLVTSASRCHASIAAAGLFSAFVVPVLQA